MDKRLPRRPSADGLLAMTFHYCDDFFGVVCGVFLEVLHLLIWIERIREKFTSDPFDQK